MKKCLICGASVDEAAKTCPKCGEGTFSAKAPEPTPAPAARVSVPAPQNTQSRPWKGKQR